LGLHRYLQDAGGKQEDSFNAGLTYGCQVQELISLQVLLSGAKIKTPAKISSGSAKNPPTTGMISVPTKASSRLMASTMTPKTRLDIFIEKPTKKVFWPNQPEADKSRRWALISDPQNTRCIPPV